MNALVVDDSRMMRKMLTHFLENLSITVTQGCDGVEGLERIEESGPFELILVDWDMPNMNGLDFVKNARADEKNKDTKILMVTSHNSVDDVMTAMETGINDFLMKPVDEIAVKEKLTILGVL